MRSLEDTHGASKPRQRRGVRQVALILSSLTILLVLMSGAQASAATLETPQATTPVFLHATATILEGVLNPAGEGEPGTYEFLYRKSATECQGGLTTPQELSLDGSTRHLEVYVEGLTQDTQYTVCLLARNSKGQEALSAPVTFTTPTPAQTPITGQVTQSTASSARLNGILNPQGKSEPGHYQFWYAASPTECRGGAAAPSAPAPANGNPNEAVEATATELSPATTYDVCLVAESDHGEEVQGVPVTFTTLTAAPSVSQGEVVSIGGQTANVKASIGPGGLATSYHAELITQAQFDASGWSEATRVPETDAELPATSDPLPVAETLNGLQPATGYRFRFVATNSLGTTEGPETTFTTPRAGNEGFALPDGRVEELVSSSGSAGEPYPPATPPLGFRTITDRLFQAAADGDAMTYAGEPGLSGGTGESGPGLGVQWMATRTSEGWRNEVITPTNTQFSSYQWFSSDLSTAILDGRLQPPLVSEALVGCQDLYVRPEATPTYTPVFNASGAAEHCGHPLYAGSSQTGVQIFQSEAALTPNAQAITELLPGHLSGHQQIGTPDEACMFGCNLYASLDGRLILVNVVEGAAVPGATFGGYPDEDSKSFTDFSNAISLDGSRIFWTDTQLGAKMEHVYVLENGSSTVQVSGAGPAQYWTATPDGRYAFYTEAGELWRFDTSTNTRMQLAGPSADVEGVIGVNQTGGDGEDLYFVAAGVLSSTSNARGERPSQGQPNLYLRHDGATVFIVTLSPKDNQITTGGEGAGGDWQPNIGQRTAEVTLNGDNLIFESVQPLTGYDNRRPDGHLLSEVFIYTASDAQLACTSCSVTGAASSIDEEADSTKLPVSGQSDIYMRRWVSDDGDRVFFNSAQALAPSDTNGRQDVYEWEREGTSGCPAQTPPSLNGGCVSLLSGGTSKSSSLLVDADASGDNVFFEHLGPLGGVDAPVDHNELYDARVNGGFSHSSLSCTGTGCQGVPPAPPSFATPASVTFAGEGNFPPAGEAKGATPKKKTAAELRAGKLTAALKACRRVRSSKKRVACEKRARTRYGVEKPKRAGHERRTK
jgi:hypothetical protein